MKEEARRLLREKVTAQLGPLVEAQIKNALGIKYLVVRERKGGKPPVSWFGGGAIPWSGLSLYCPSSASAESYEERSRKRRSS